MYVSYPLSSKRSSNVNCVQQEREATGEGFKVVYECVAKHWPQILSLECVKQLNQKTDDQDMSDTSYILQKLRAAGYWAHADVLVAEDFGAPGPRERTYWAGLLGLAGNPDHITESFNKVLASLKVGPVFDVVEDFLTMDEQERSAVAAALHIPQRVGHKDSKSLKDKPQLEMRAQCFL